MRSENATKQAIELYADTVRRICFIHMKNHSDVDDVFQEVFLKHMLRDSPFESEAHEKAWLIRVAINACKDSLRSYFRKNTVPLRELQDEVFETSEQQSELLEAVFKLPANYRTAVYLHYYEGYPAVEIAKILGRRPNTIYTWLGRARDRLRQILGD
jgi:RNA polymerase sigma-70 factor (ECF subfamily)